MTTFLWAQIPAEVAQVALDNRTRKSFSLRVIPTTKQLKHLSSMSNTILLACKSVSQPHSIDINIRFPNSCRLNAPRLLKSLLYLRRL